MNSHVSSHVPSVITPIPACESGIDYVFYAQKLKELREEYQRNEASHETRQAQIKAETQQILHLLNGSVGSNTGVTMASDSHQPNRKVEKPRPLDDKLSIAAGRAIVRAMKLRKPPEQCRQEGINAATATAKRYGLEVLPADIVALIDKKIKTRFNLY